IHGVLVGAIPTREEEPIRTGIDGWTRHQPHRLSKQMKRDLGCAGGVEGVLDRFEQGTTDPLAPSLRGDDDPGEMTGTVRRSIGLSIFPIASGEPVQLPSLRRDHRPPWEVVFAVAK